MTPRETLLITTRNQEAEPVRVETSDDTVRLILDDGETLIFDRCELLAAAGGHAVARLGAVA